MDDLQAFRRAKDESFRDFDSPLDPSMQVGFRGLKYFPPNPELALRLPLETDGPHDSIVMETSDGRKRDYRRAGRIRLTVDGSAVVLTVYQDGHGYFLPFRDGTSGKETYPAGRYLEPAPTEDGRLAVDFNYAYNPYCAYSPRYSCPLPPAENWLSIPIRAGERAFMKEV